MKNGIWIALVLLIVGSLLVGCSAPQYVWPQEDMAMREVNRPSMEKKVLIASRQSEFKNEVVRRIEDAFRQQPVYIKVIGIDALENEDPNRYSAVVVINTAMAWRADYKVEAFLDRNEGLSSIIVLTTSGGGDVLPEQEGRAFDAVSSASTPADAQAVADQLIHRIEGHL